MAMPPNDRPLATVREETIDARVTNYGRGTLSLEAFERRLDQALAAETGEALARLCEDLSVATDVEELRRQQSRLGWTPARPARPDASMQRSINIFGGGRRAGTWLVAPELLVVCLFGGTEIDFSSATFSAPVTRIQVWCVFGGAQFTVNEHTNVANNLICIFGGADDRATGSARPDAPTIVLEGLALFGGIGIKVRRALKERWLEFAQQVKSAFQAPAAR